MPASASVPSREIHQVSISPVADCASMIRILGQAMCSSIGRTGSWSSRKVRALWAGGMAVVGA